MKQDQVLFYLNRMRNSLPHVKKQEDMAKEGMSYESRQVATKQGIVHAFEREAIDTAIAAVGAMGPNDQAFDDAD